MTYLSQTAPLVPQNIVTFLSSGLAGWRAHSAAIRARRHLATLDDRAFSDLGLSREIVDPPWPRDAAGLWLSRLSG